MRARTVIIVALIGILLWTGGLVARVPQVEAAPPPQGEVIDWGLNHRGQLGDGQECSNLRCTSPVYLDAPTGITMASGGAFHTLALAGDGTIWAWGDNEYGALGDGQGCGIFSCLSPVHLAAPTGIIAVAGGDIHSLALAGDGTVWAWGYNQYGVVGDGQGCGTTRCASPVHLAAPTGIIAIAAGGRHSLALAGDGTVWSWGNNSFGQLGDGQDCGLVCTRPVHLTVPTGIVAIAAGANHSLALAGDGTVWAWGNNDVGQLGDGQGCGASFCSSPVHLTAPLKFTAIAAGADHNLALAGDGTVWSWGNNYFGQLGDSFGCDSPCSTPFELSTLGGITAVAAGVDFSLALGDDGTVWVWGRNDYGQLGDGQGCGGNSCPFPVHLTAPTGITAIAAGGYHSIALTNSLDVIVNATVTVASPRSASYGAASVTLDATVTIDGAAAEGGTVTFTVTDGANEQVGNPVQGPVIAGETSASFPLAGVAAGTYRVAARYQGEASGTSGTAATPGTLTITKAPLTVKVSDQTRQFGESTPVPCVLQANSPNGFVNGDDIDDIGGAAALSCATTAAASTTTGRFPLTPRGFSSDNYTIKYTGALLTITPRKVAPTLTSDPSATPESPATRGQAIVLSATVPVTPSGVAPRGTVQFWVNGRSVASVSLVGGRAEYRFTPTVAGTHRVEVRYSSTDMRFVAAAVATNTLTVR